MRQLSAVEESAPNLWPTRRDRHLSCRLSLLYRARLGWTAGVSWLMVTAAACGQVLPAAESATSTVLPRVEVPATMPLLDSLQKGVELEQEGRWRDALTHYEDAVRQNPERMDLHERLSLVRIRFDLIRRVSDPSYQTLISGMTPPQALDIFSEVAGKVESHHVAEPDWTAWMLRGTDGLIAALAEDSFVRQHHVTATAEQRQWVGAEIRRILSDRKVVDRHDARSLVQWAAQIVEERLGVPQPLTTLEYVCGLVNSLDNYSAFLTPAQLDEVYSQIEGNFVGLGVELKPEGEHLLITHVIPGGPAERAGILTGDHIWSVDGERMPQITPDKAADMLKGEQGSQVTIEVVSGQNPPRQVRVTRDRVEVPSVEGVKLIDPENGIGYLRITSFQKTTSRDMDAALWKLYREGMRSLIVDVRGNPGGLLNESVDVADKFVTEGTIVKTRGRIAEEDFDFRAHRVGTWGVPLVVVINGDSASASEIFAGAIRDHRRGTIVGERSYGKGSVQGIFPLRALKAGVRLTTAKFYSPSGQAISYFGVQPDVQVHQVARAGETTTLPVSTEDPFLKAALQAARQNLAQR